MAEAHTADDDRASGAAARASVFVSYAREDEKQAQRIVEALEQAGYSVWWDGLLRGGERFGPAIETALERARAVVVLWSRHAIVSHWVQDEAARGRDRHCLVPASLDGAKPPLGFRQFHVIDLSQQAKPDAAALAPLLDAVRSLHADAPPRAPEAASPPRAAGLDRRRLLLGGGAAVAVTALAGGLWRGLSPRAVEAGSGSVAVLPFTNISGDPSQGYFSDGLAAEVRAELTRNALLHVVGQASSNVFRDRKDDAKAISRQLGVAFLLDGNVRRAGNTLRVVAELVEGSSGFSRWSQTFDRSIDDVFAVQREIAGAVGAAISRNVTPAAGGAAGQVGGTADPVAYDCYLKGRDLYALSADEHAEREALALFERALAADPNYGAAQAARSRSLAALANNYAQGEERASLYEQAIAAALRAVALAPQLADAHSALGYALFNGRLAVAAARSPYERSRELGAGDADVLIRYALYCARTGLFDAARGAIDRAVSLDPLNARAHASIGEVAFAAGRYADALPAIRQALTLNPRLPGAHATAGASYLMLGDVAAARAEFAAEQSLLYGLPGLAIIAHRQGRQAEAQAALARLIEEDGDNSLYQQAQVYAQWGDRDRAMAALRAARKARDAGLIYLRNDPWLDVLRGDAEFRGLLKDLGFS